MADIKQNDLFDRYYHETYQRAYQQAYAITQDVHLAHDAVQEAYLSIFKKLSNGEAMPRAAGCVINLAMHRARDLLRKQKRQLPVNQVALASLADNARSSNCPDPYQDLERQELAEQISAWMQRLRPDHRQAIILSYQYDIPAKEVARIMDFPLATIKTWMRRAKAKLRVYLTNDPAMREYMQKGGRG